MKAKFATLALLAVLFAAAPVRADEKASDKEKGACKADAAALCKDVKKGAKRACLAQNLEKIQNADCKARVQKYQEEDAALKQACSAEMTDKGPCAGMDMGTGLMKCLDKHRKILSDPCKALFKADRKGGKKMGAHKKAAKPSVSEPPAEKSSQQ